MAAIETTNEDRLLETSNKASKDALDGLNSGPLPAFSPPTNLGACTATPEANNDTPPARTSKQGDGNARDVPVDSSVGSGPKKYGSPPQQDVCTMLAGTIE